MNSLHPSLRQRNWDVGYALYSAGLPISHCHNDDQRSGWRNAERGHMAAANADTERYISRTRSMAESWAS